MGKRKISAVASNAGLDAVPLPPPINNLGHPPPLRVPSRGRGNFDAAPVVNGHAELGSHLSIEPVDEPTQKKRQSTKPSAQKAEKEGAGVQVADAKIADSIAKPKELEDIAGDPEAEADVEADPEEVKEAAARPPAVNSDYLPLPWKGRLGYACLCTYLRYSNPPVFTSRTTRIASILEHRHPLRDPSQPEHAVKNRPDKSKPADIRLGQAFVEQLCLANVRDMIKILRWNDKYNIKFFRLSSEAFPFASHEEYGYKLAPFAADALAEVGKVVAELGHRVSTHPGQFTQLGSPRPQVIENAIRDLEYHDEMLSLLRLPEQQNKDAIMVLHMGGVYGDKAATLDRFRANYRGLSASIKNRLVLENDDVSWSVHDLLPVCQELNIPLVLDYHHNNIIFDAAHIREGTRDIMDWYDAIRATWTRKGITQKMHYSEPTPDAVSGRQRRKHNPRVATLPPCPPDMDLMIEAKDKEQAVFELMRIFKLPGYDLFNNVIPHVREDDNKSLLAEMKKAEKKKATPQKRRRKAKDNEDDESEANGEAEEIPPELIPPKQVGMGGPLNRVYWPPGMEDWLRPEKRTVKKKDAAEIANPVQRLAAKKAAKAEALALAASNGNAVSGIEERAADTSEPAPKISAKKTKAAAKVTTKTPRTATPRRTASASKSKPQTAISSDSEFELAAAAEEDEEEEDEEDNIEAKPRARAAKKARVSAPRRSSRAA